jgi:hypothetical protein
MTKARWSGLWCAGLLWAASCDVAPGLELTRGYDASEHERAFPVGEGAVHALGKNTDYGVITCDSCHTDTPSFAQATCLNCHRQDRSPSLAQAHKVVAGFVADDARCLSCHPTGERGAAYGFEEHSRDQFPIGPDSAHGGAAYQAVVPGGAQACESCHASVEDRTILLCAECHARDEKPPEAVHNSFVASFEAESCIACHAETPAYTLAQHFEDIALPHSGVSTCRTCHENNRGEPRPWAIDFAAPMPFAGVNCVQCHAPDGTPTVLDRHEDDNFPIGAGTPHGNAAYGRRIPAGKDRCSACHASVEEPSALLCAQCHANDPEPPAEAHRALATSFAVESCEACHATTPAFTLADHFDVMPLPHSGIATCRSCHENNRTALKTWAIDFEAPMPFSSPSCVACHAGGEIPDVDAHSETNFPIGPDDQHGDAVFLARIPADQNRCTACHTSVDDVGALRCAECHVADTPPTATTHSAFPDSFASQSCQACHATLPAVTVAAHAVDLALPHEGVVECVECHTRSEAEPRSWAIDFRAPVTYDRPVCQGCHAGDVVVDPAVHSAENFPIGAGDAHGGAAYLARLAPGENRCSACHVDTATPRVLRCASCHAQDTPSTAVAHAAFAASFATETCEACHATTPALTLAQHAVDVALPHEGVMDCRQCHVADEPAPRDWTIDFRAPVGREGPGCAGCHPGGLVVEPGLHSVDDFPIEATDLHGNAAYLARVAPGENRCTACHLDVNNPGQLKCAACHARDPAPPVLTHATFASSLETETCESCHATTPAFTLVEHATSLPVPHEGTIDCRTCHADNEVGTRPWTIDFRSPVSFDPPACTTCHPGGLVLETATHAADIFPIAADELHGDAAYLARAPVGENRCTSCHVDVSAPDRLKCATCHAADVPATAETHASFASSFSTETCQACHATAPAFTLAQHAAALPLPHEAVIDCRSCHTNNKPDPQTWTIDFRQPMPFGAPTCASCHPGGLVFTTVEHATTIFPITATDQHGNAAYAARLGVGQNRCTSCHVDVATPAELRCVSCHNNDANPPSNTHAAFAASFAVTTCEACHATTPTTRIGANDPEQNQHPRLSSPTTGIPWSHFGVERCELCHVTRLPPPQEWSLDFKGAMPFQSAACRNCHQVSPCNAANQSLCDGT